MTILCGPPHPPLPMGGAFAYWAGVRGETAETKVPAPHYEPPPILVGADLQVGPTSGGTRGDPHLRPKRNPPQHGKRPVRKRSNVLRLIGNQVMQRNKGRENTRPLSRYGRFIRG